VAFSYAGNAEAAEATRRAVEAAGGRAIAVKSDAAEESDVVGLFDTAVKAFGPIDGVVNNAGIIIPPPMKVVDMGVDRLQKIVAINLIGAFIVARRGAARPHRDRDSCSGGRSGPA
jgi:NAD(P)-dependent dehydrogenase (short-subunit alcohol dehydrogenase family)